MSIIPTCVYACDHIYIYTHSQVNDTYSFTHINYTNIYTCVCELYIHTYTQLYTTHETSGSERKPKSVLLAEAAVGATSYVGFPIPSPHWTLGARWDLHTQELHTGEEPWSYIGCSPPDRLLTQG